MGLETSDDALTINGNVISRKKALIAIAKKSGFLVAVAGIDLGAEFFKVFLLSKLGIESLAGSTLIYSTTKFIIDPYLIITNQNAVFIAREYGKIKNLVPETLDDVGLINSIDNAVDIPTIYKNIGNIARQGWYVGGIISIPCGITLFFIEPLLNALKISSEISSVVGRYFRPVAISIPFLILANINERLLVAIDKEKWLPPYRIFMSALSIGLNILLIPKHGTFGAGITILVQGLTGTLITSLFLALKKDLKQIQIFDFKYFPHSYIKNMFMQGFPMATALFALTGSNFAISIFVGHLGKLRLAIEQPIVQFFAIATTLAHGINEASNMLVGQTLGEHNYRLMRTYGNMGLLTSSLLFIPFAITYNNIPLKLASVFMKPSAIEGAEDLIRYTFIIMTLAKFMTVVQDSTALNLAGMEDTFFASAVSFITTIALILPLAAISTYLTNFDVYGIAGAINVGLLVAGGLTARHWFKQSNAAVDTDNFDTNADTSNVKFSTLISSIPFFKRCCRTRASIEELPDLEIIEESEEASQTESFISLRDSN